MHLKKQWANNLLISSNSCCRYTFHSKLECFLSRPLRWFVLEKVLQCKQLNWCTKPSNDCTSFLILRDLSRAKAFSFSWLGLNFTEPSLHDMFSPAISMLHPIWNFCLRPSGSETYKSACPSLPDSLPPSLWQICWNSDWEICVYIYWVYIYTLTPHVYIFLN